MNNKSTKYWGSFKGKKIEWLPIFIFTIWILAMHFVAVMGTGDDSWFYDTAHTADFHLTEWLHGRYEQWSSRTLIEGALMISVCLPGVLWRLFDTAVMMVSVLTIIKMFGAKEHRFYGNYFAAALFLIADYTAMGTAGWQATTINYLWPMTALLIALYPLCRWIREENIRPYEYPVYIIAALFAASSEQACVLLLIVYICFGIYLYQKRSCGIFYGVQIAIAVIGLLNVMLCPGNTARNLQETRTWFPEYANFSLLQKIDLGISSTIRSLFLEKNLIFVLLTVIIAVLSWCRYKEWIQRALGVIPMLVVGGLNALRIAFGGQNRLFSFVTANGVLFESGRHSWKVMMWYAFLLLICAVIVVDLFLLVENIWKALLLDLIFLLGLMTKAMLGFSATIWASYARTGWYCQIACICCILFLLEEWKYKNKKVTQLLLFLFGVLAVIGAVHNYLSVFAVAI